jgi:hypothetical protein
VLRRFESSPLHQLKTPPVDYPQKGAVVVF